MKEKEKVDLYKFRVLDKPTVFTVLNQVRGSTLIMFEGIGKLEECPLALKFFTLVLLKVSKIVKLDGRLTKDSIYIHGKELIETGVFQRLPKDADDLYFSSAMEFKSLAIEVRSRHKHSLGVLFTGGKLGKSSFRIYLNPQLDWYFLVHHFLDSTPGFIIDTLPDDATISKDVKP